MLVKATQDMFWPSDKLEAAIQHVPQMSIWRWEASGDCWTQITDTVQDWLRFRLGGLPLRGVPAGPAHFVCLLGHDEGAITNLVPFFFVVDETGRIAECIQAPSPLGARLNELEQKRRLTASDAAELDQLRQQIWGRFDPNAQMIRALIRDLPWSLSPQGNHWIRTFLHAAGLDAATWHSTAPPGHA